MAEHLAETRVRLFGDGPVYLDYNATTPIDPEVADAMLPCLSSVWGNPSSTHCYGRSAKETVERGRELVAAAINCSSSNITFTSGGTESNNWAVKGAAFALRDKGDHIITSQIEHPAIIEVCRYLETEGFKVTYVGVNAEGVVKVDDIVAALTPATVLITIMHSNNETGALQPIKEIVALAKARGIATHTDASQSMGKVLIDATDLAVDYLTLCSHKFYSPKGVGALYVADGAVLPSKVMHGAGHEFGRRAGTENIVLVAGMSKGCEIASRDLDKNAAHMLQMRERLHAGLLAGVPDLKLNGPAERLPNTLNVSFPGVPANDILHEISSEVAASAGAACHSGTVEMSCVLLAMRVPEHVAMGTVRFSTGKFTNETDIDIAISAVVKAVTKLRAATARE